MSEAGGTAPVQRTYACFGLRIRSALDLPELSPAPEGPVDVAITVGRTGQPAPPAGRHVIVEPDAASIVLGWGDVASFLIEGPNRIVVERHGDVTDEILRLPLLGPVMATLLHRRGLLVLHASSVSVNGSGIVFMADSGVGKSTTLAAFVGRGHGFLVDDTTAIVVSEDGGLPPAPVILPGYPEMKITEGAARDLLVGSGRTLVQPHPDGVREKHRLRDWAPPARVPAGALFLLARGEAPAIVPLSPQQAVAALLHHSFVPNRLHRPMRPEESARHLAQVARLAQSGRLFMLVIPPDLGRLGDVVSLVEGHVAETTGAAAVPGRSL